MDVADRLYSADDVDTENPIASFWHLLDQGMVTSRAKKGLGFSDPLNFIERRGFDTSSWRQEGTGLWQFIVKPMPGLVFTVEFVDGHGIVSTPIDQPDGTELDLYVEKFHIQLKHGWSVAWVKLYGTVKTTGERIEHTYNEVKN